MVGPTDTLGSPWPSLEICPWVTAGVTTSNVPHKIVPKTMLILMMNVLEERKKISEVWKKIQKTRKIIPSSVFQL
jgi:hypothetical protein